MILVIYRANAFQQTITQCLSEQAFLYDAVSSFNTAASLLSIKHYALIIVEVGACSDCLTRIELLVKQNPDSWIIALESQDSLSLELKADEVDYFDAGVDDFLKGAFNERVFLARVRSHMRRCIPITDAKNQSSNLVDHIEVGPLQIDQRYHSVMLNGQTLSLTAREFALLDYFCRHPNQVFSRNQLLSAVWGDNHEGYEHTVNTHINRLRSKLDKVTSMQNAGQLVQTVWGVGYKLNVSGYVAKALSA